MIIFNPLLNFVPTLSFLMTRHLRQHLAGTQEASRTVIGRANESVADRHAGGLLSYAHYIREHVFVATYFS